MYLKGVAPGTRVDDGYTGLPIPYGFGFSIDGGEDTGTGIGGANFITVNPFKEDGSSFINSINVLKS